MNPLKKHLHENPERYGHLDAARALLDASDRLYEMICETYEFETRRICGDTRYVSPHLNVRCGVTLDIHNGSIIMSACIDQGYGPDRLERAKALFKLDATAAAADHGQVAVSIVLPVNWDTNPVAIADIATLCGYVFRASKS